MNDTYTTPEGFVLHRPLLLPDARSFDEVLEYISEWDHDTMTGRNGVVKAEVPEPQVIDGNEIGPYCTVDLSQIGGAKHRSMAVHATPATLSALRGRIVTDHDHMSFQVIAHKQSERALVILQHGYIIGSHWLAYIDPATIPGGN